MTKKAIQFRPMFGFGGKPKPALHEWSELGKANFRVQDEAKDAIIAELRAKIAELEAREAKRRAGSRDAMRKKRASDRSG